MRPFVGTDLRGKLKLHPIKEGQETPQRLNLMDPSPIYPTEDALFPLYLRCRSSSCSSAKGIHDDNKDNNSSNGSLSLQTVTPGDACLSTAEDIYRADSIGHDTVKPNNVPVKTKKPRITLRIPQPDPRIKPKKVATIELTKANPGLKVFSSEAGRRGSQETTDLNLISNRNIASWLCGRVLGLLKSHRSWSLHICTLLNCVLEK